MKFFKYSIMALAAVTMTAGFTACSDDDDYTPGPAVNGVCFAADAPTAVEVSKTATDFSVQVVRSGLTEAATYTVVATTDAPAGVFTLPTTVTFAAGAEATDYVITYDPELLDQTYTIELAFAEGTNLSPYGASSYKFTVTAAAAYSGYKLFQSGQGTYTYISLPQQLGLPAEDPGLPIYYQTNLDNPNDLRFTIDAWSFNSTLVFNLDQSTSLITIPMQPWTEGDASGNQTQIQVNVNGLGVCDMYLLDLESYAKIFSPNDLASFEGTSYYLEDEGLFVLGIVYLAHSIDDGGYYVLNGGYGQEFFQLDGFANAAVEMEYNGTFADKMNNQSAVFTVSVGAAASKCIIAASKTLKGQSLVSAIVNGTITGVEVAPGENQNILVPIEGAGSYDAAIVSWKNDEPNQYATTSFTVQGSAVAEDAEWKSNGVGELTDGWFLAPFTFSDRNDPNVKYTYEDLPWEIMVDRNVKTPSLYRMVNPWSDPSSFMVQMEINEDPEPANILIDCANPDFVIIDPQYSGFSMTMPGDQTASKLYMGNYAFFVGESLSDGTIVTEDLLINAGLNSVLEDGIVYVPVGACCFGYNATDQFGYSWVDSNREPFSYGIIYLGDPSLQSRMKAQRRAQDLAAARRAFTAGMNTNLQLLPKGQHARVKNIPANLFLIKK